MASKLHLEQLLEPFTTNLKSSLKLPISPLEIQTLLKSFFTQEELVMTAHKQAPTTHLPHTSSIFTLKADPLATPFYLTLATPAKLKLLEIFFENEQPFSDIRLEEGSIGFLITYFLQALNTSRLFSRLSFYLTDNTPPHESLQHLQVELTLPHSAPLILDLYFPESFVESFCDLYEDETTQKRLRIPLPISLHIGKICLAPIEFNALKAHDLVLLDASFYQPDTEKGMAHLVCQNVPFAQVRLSGHSLKLLDFNPLPEEVSMEQNFSSPLTHLQEVSLELQVEFTTLKLKLEELERLSEGQTLEFHKEHPTQVFLTLQGQRVAKGELVKVGEQMAFLVQEIHNG